MILIPSILSRVSIQRYRRYYRRYLIRKDEALKVRIISSYGSDRVIMGRDGEPLFCGKDVATCLGYADPTKAVYVHVDDEDKTMFQLEHTDETAGCLGSTQAMFITESGLYDDAVAIRYPIP